MPLYEGIGLISEKHAVVFDIGSAYTKAGFAGETGPRCIIPSQIVDRKTKQKINISEYSDIEHLYQILVDFIHHLYFRHLLVNPKDRRVVIVESILTPTVFRDTLAKVLFMHYEVSSIVFVPSHLMSLFTLGISSAIVIDSGYRETEVFPIYEGIVMVNSGETVPFAAKAIHKSIEHLIMAECNVQGSDKVVPFSSLCDKLEERSLEDIKVRACFITTIERGQLLLKLKNNEESATPYLPPPGVDYPLDGDKVLHIPGKIREAAAEVLFELDIDFQSVATLVLDTILKSPIDMRRTLAENIVFIGGTAMMCGFKSRMKDELISLLKHPKYEKRLAIKNFKFHQVPAKENYAAWLGAAIFGATDVITTRSLTREKYLQHKCIPDWSNINNNNFDEEKTI